MTNETGVEPTRGQVFDEQGRLSSPYRDQTVNGVPASYVAQETDDHGEFWAPAPANQPAQRAASDYWTLRRNDLNLCSGQLPDGKPGMWGLGRCTLGFGHNGPHGDLIDRLGGEALRERIVRALLLPVGVPRPTGLPSYQTSDPEEAESIAATVVRALFPEQLESTDELNADIA